MFYERYFDFKHPFKTGDILKMVYDKDDSLYIIGNNPMKRTDGNGGDFSDSGILVNHFDRETGFMWDSDTHENPYLS